MLRAYITLAMMALTPGGDASVPTKMKAAGLTKRPWDLKIHLENFEEFETDVPQAKQGEVVIKVVGASINPCEWKQYESPTALTMSYPHIAGYDVAGEVAVAGPGSAWKVGDKVWGMAGSAHAEYVAVPSSSLGLAPNNIPLTEAAVFPLVALTDLEGFRFAEGPWSKKEQVVVVLGGSGGTGHMAIQLAKAWGATKVITTCGTDHVGFCTSLGADQVIDYHKEDWTKVVSPKSVDFVYDCVAITGTGDKAYPLIKDNGFFVTLLPGAVASKATASQRPSIKQEFFLLSQTGTKNMDVLKDLVEAGKLRGHIDKTFALSEIAQVFNASLSGHTTGKVSVQPAKGKIVV